MRGFGIKNVNKKCDKIRMIFEWPGKSGSVSFVWRNQNIYTLWWIVSGIGAFLSKFVIGSQAWAASGILFSDPWFMELLFCFSSSSQSFCSDQTPSEQRYIRPWQTPPTPIYLTYPISFIFGQNTGVTGSDFPPSALGPSTPCARPS